MTIYNKKCVYCGKEYQSTARNSRYCSSECCEKAQVVNKKKKKVRQKKRKLYEENKEINRALSKAYALAHEVADLYKIPKVCAHSDYDGECTETMELHHKDLNPFNNAPWNLEWICKRHHKAHHDRLGDVNMVETYNECVDSAGFEEEEDKSDVMVKCLKEKLKKASEGFIDEVC